MKRKIVLIIAVMLMTAAVGCANNKDSGSNNAAAENNIAEEAEEELPECMSYYCYVDEQAGKTGYKDAAGNVVIEPQFQDCQKFAKNGLAAVKTDDKYGYIDAAGNMVIEPEFDVANPFGECGLASANKAGEMLFGYIDSTGEFVIEPKFEVAGDFNKKGAAWVGSWEKNEFGLINTQGEYITDTKVYLPSFNSDPDFMNVIVEPYESAGFMNSSGEFVIEPKYQMVRPFAPNGLAKVTFSDETTGIYNAFIDKNGKEVIKFENVTETGNFGANGLAPIEKEFKPDNIEDCFEIGPDGKKRLVKDKFGYINEKGDFVIEDKFDYAGDFMDNGLAWVCVEDKYGYIDSSGGYVIEPKFDKADDFEDGYAIVEVNGKKGVIDESGNFVIEPEYDGLTYVSSSGLFYASIDGEDGTVKDYIIDRDGSRMNRVRKKLGESKTIAGLEITPQT